MPLFCLMIAELNQVVLDISSEYLSSQQDLIVKNWCPVYTSHHCFLFILRFQLLKLKHSQIWLCEQLGKNGYHSASIWNVRRGKQVYKVLLEMLSGLLFSCTDSGLPTGLTWWISPPLPLVVLKPVHEGWKGHSTLWSLLHLKILSWVFEFEMISFVCF
jgi:hypothetical protein